MRPVGDPDGADRAVGDLLDAADSAADIVARGKDAWDADRLLRLAGEAVINRIGDAAGKLSDDDRAAMPNVHWDEIKSNRILVAHIYHRIDYEIIWETLVRDVPQLTDELERWRARGHRIERPRGKIAERDTGLDLGP